MIVVWGLDWKTASLSVREQIALPEEREEFFLRDVRGLPGIQGCVLISTCNRFEVYMDARDGLDVEALLRQCLGLLAPRAGMADAGMYHFEGEGARRRLLEVACGLHSQILGEEQILTQVRQAVEKARAAATTTAVLETLFRIAVTAGKASRTQVQIKALAPSTAAKAVALAQNALGALAGRRALVIGNGEMGRLAAELLVEAGCRVTITLRSYRHGKTLVPPGCQTVAYDARAQFMNGCDLVVSATRSPHYTITEGMMAALDTPPPVLVDMAMPRDVQPACRPYCRAAFFDMDDLRDGEEKACGKELAQIHAVIEKQMDDFEKWMRGRSRQQAEKEGVAVFAGTSEGRLLCGHLAREGVAATVFVATEYGRAVLPRLPGLTVLAGRLDAEEMAAALGAASTVVDATHPYAVEASQNIKQAAGRAGARYLRLLRPRQALSQAVETVPDTAAAVRFLQDTEGPVLLTTGSKELPAYTGIPGFETRLHARVLPDAAVVERCRQLGFAPQNLICMQGPFPTS